MGNDLSTALKSKKNGIINNKNSDLNNVYEVHNRKSSMSTTRFPIIESNIDEENGRHEHLLKVWGSNFYSPIESILESGDAKVLDIGCGFGSWIYDMAKNYPLSHFTGIDINNPKDATLPNVSLTQGDVLEGLPYPDCSFDYIHFRDFLWSISSKDASNKLFPELIRILKPGGWIEGAEFDVNILNVGPNTKFLNDALFNHIRNNGNHPEEFYKNTSKLFKKHNLEYQIEERILCFVDYDLSKKKFVTFYKTIKSMILEYTSISYQEYDEILDKACVELEEYRTSYRLIRYFGKKLLA
ncbi:30354_t:CDS:2 [Gigaspora margarita]|uniref:30354_t:CDS:1 n=1 Tax=Gigaspora margarita TaxID=4874 RepID=A0ABN7WAI1_GIGMA|nr:30354_t:CDS:2 [Gigaspora margarita]